MLNFVTCGHLPRFKKKKKKLGDVTFGWYGKTQEASHPEFENLQNDIQPIGSV